MAILKHRTNKNPNYSDAMDYLLFQHDEYTMKPILDEQGRKQLREEYYIDGINCDPMFFDRECEMLNQKYHKNLSYDEVKSHHYILSFDPSDKTERGLTGEKAQQLGLEFARKNFPGHQALVVTHTDGHNHSGNIHVHIVINSLRKLDVAEQEFMERPCDHKAGYKHHQTRALLTHMQKSLMEICQREGLHQIDLHSPSPVKINEAEYWAGRRGQKELDAINQQITDRGLSPTQTTFRTQKQMLRNVIEEIAASAKDFEDFQSQLFEKYQITVMEKRGRYSYHLPDREKNISERSLGTNYGKAYLEEMFGVNSRTEHKEKTGEERTAEEWTEGNAAAEDVSGIDDGTASATGTAASFHDKTVAGNDYPELAGNERTRYDYHEDPVAILYVRSHLRLVTDLQTCVKAQQNRAYAQKVKLTNLKQMAETIVYVQEHGYDTREDLQIHYSEISGKRDHSKNALTAVSAKLKATNLQIHHLGIYQTNKRIYAQYQNSRNKKNFRTEHAQEITAYEKSRNWLQQQFPDSPFPNLSDLRSKKEKLEQRKNALQGEYDYYNDFEKDLRTVRSNVESILEGEGHQIHRSREETLE